MPKEREIEARIEDEKEIAKSIHLYAPLATSYFKYDTNQAIKVRGSL